VFKYDISNKSWILGESDENPMAESFLMLYRPGFYINRIIFNRSGFRINFVESIPMDIISEAREDALQFFNQHFYSLCDIGYKMEQLREIYTETNIGKKIDIEFRHPFGGSDVVSVELLKILKSAEKPALLKLYKKDKTTEIVIRKEGDDLRNDQFCLAMLRLFNLIWEKEKIIVPYGEHNQLVANICYNVAVSSISGRDGFIQYIPNCTRVRDLWNRNNWFYKLLDGYSYKRQDWTFNCSLIGSIIATFLGSFLLGVRARKSGNMLLDPNNNIFNIDFWVCS